jgi:protein-S-isoprenylcysteine O-methyltransferase Ste14
MRIPELFVVLLIGVVWIIPIAAAVWALMTLYRIRATQEDMRQKLDGLARLLQAGRTP